MRTRTTTRRFVGVGGAAAAGVATLMLGLMFVLGACGATSSESKDVAIESSGDSAGGQSGSRAAPESADAVNERDAGAAKVSGVRAQRKPDLATKVISTGSVSLSARDLGKTRFELVRAVDALGGQITDEETYADDDGVVHSSRLVVRVPSTDFDRAMTRIGRIGHRTAATRKSEDVTTQVLDTDARVRAQTAALRRVEALMSRARSMRDVIALETELSNRQAELDSLTSQQAWLADQTSMSTIRVYLERSTSATSPVDHTAFVDGLIRGWQALTGLAANAAALLGAVLPFLVLVVPVGLLLRWWLRRGRVTPVPAADAG